MKSVICERCNGSGQYLHHGMCIRCQGLGVLTHDRLFYLRDEYWPNRAAKHSISQQVADREIEIIKKILNEMGPQDAEIKQVDHGELIRIGEDHENIFGLKGIHNRVAVHTLIKNAREKYSADYELVLYKVK